MPHARKVDVAFADRLAFSLPEVSALTGFSISYLYELMERGVFRTKRVEGRRIATAGAVAELLGVASLAEVLGTRAEAQQPPPELANDTVAPATAVARRSLSRAPPRRTHTAASIKQEEEGG
jgi:predicted DNA-binding transcriptional regulator AlpA